MRIILQCQACNCKGIINTMNWTVFPKEDTKKVFIKFISGDGLMEKGLACRKCGGGNGGPFCRCGPRFANISYMWKNYDWVRCHDFDGIANDQSFNNLGTMKVPPFF